VKKINLILMIFFISLTGCATKSIKAQTDCQTCNATIIEEPKQLKGCKKNPTLWRKLGIEK